MMRIIKCLIVMMLVVTPLSAKAKDYGLGHGAIVYFADYVIRDVNNIILKNKPELSKNLSDIEVTTLALYYCHRESKARGTYDISKWDNLTGDYDSTFDCLTPLALGGYKLYISNTGVPMFTIFHYSW